MRTRELHLRKYNWRVSIFYAVSCYHTDHIMAAMERLRPSAQILERIYSNLTKCSMDTGFTFSSKSDRETVMVVGLHSSPAQFLNSLEHELRHLIDDIAQYYDLDMGGEEVAYLTGDINEAIIEDVQYFICQCRCHHDAPAEPCGCS